VQAIAKAKNKSIKQESNVNVETLFELIDELAERKDMIIESA
jgi:hypothetical protein